MRVTLASASPRRKELIKKIPDLEVDIVVSGEEENVCESVPALLTQKLALVKAKSVFGKVGGVVIGADTVVCVDGRILGKPKTADEARSFFRLLCSRSHEVITGLAVISEEKVVTDSVTSFVTFNDYDERVIERYIASGSPFDKAGGYGVQDELFAPMVKGVEGDQDNVIGLPTVRLAQILEENFR